MLVLGVSKGIFYGITLLVAELHDMPWVIAADFNETLTVEDKLGGRAVGVNSSLQFKKCLDNCNMIDIGFFRLHFTWTKKREVQAFIQFS